MLDADDYAAGALILFVVAFVFGLIGLAADLSNLSAFGGWTMLAAVVALYKAMVA